MKERKRRLNADIMSIMRPWDVELMEDYELARKEFRLAKEKYYAIKKKYNARLDELNAIFEPEIEKIYAYIDDLTNDYLLSVPKDVVYYEMTKATETNVGVSKFGRMMREMGCYLTTQTRTGPNGGKYRTRHWRKP